MTHSIKNNMRCSILLKLTQKHLRCNLEQISRKRMTKRFLTILLLIFTTQLLYSQEWHKQEYRELNFPSSIYYTQYIEYEYNKAKSKSNNKSFVLDIAKVELSKKIISEVQGESNLSTIRKGAVYNSIFNSNSKISTSATFVDLQVLESINKKKSIHILIMEKLT